MKVEHSIKRELYKAMRSLHDGICPACGGEADNNQCKKKSCGFGFTPSEVKQIRKWHFHFHKDIKSIIVKWRKNHD